ncbi:hypothetical protein BpHYR1_000987 [Brachionus plicatilis]|uniref:Uncharacterized protein n=1 Tax=Brachionus plicatilis TaxID=10195 RepID=A0A3M7QB70_BRAPC|nr:hypothetical protein BpHYR1_000987 [Brachionus plicatilis]
MNLLSKLNLSNGSSKHENKSHFIKTLLLLYLFKILLNYFGLHTHFKTKQSNPFSIVKRNKQLSAKFRLPAIIHQTNDVLFFSAPMSNNSAEFNPFGNEKEEITEVQ